MKKQLSICLTLLMGLITSCSTRNEYAIGDYYNNAGDKGVVISVNSNGQHGKIISLESMKCSGDDASATVSFLGNGWHLPSAEEIEEVHNNLDIVNQALENKGETISMEYLWTSTFEDGHQIAIRYDGERERNLPSTYAGGYARGVKDF